MLQETKGFKKIQFHRQKPNDQIINLRGCKSPTSFRQISESKEKQKPMFGKLKNLRLEEREMSSAKKPANLFTRIIESRQSSNKKSAFLDETKVSTSECPLISHNGSIINLDNKENKKPKGLKFKGFPHKKLVKVKSDTVLNFEMKSPKTQRKIMINNEPVIGSNKKKKLISGVSTDRDPYGIHPKQFIELQRGLQQRQSNIHLHESIESSIQNSVIKSQSSLLFDMSPTLV